ANLPADVRCHSAWWTLDLSFCTRGTAVKTYTYYVAQQSPGAEIPPRALAVLQQATWFLPPEKSRLDQARMKAAAAQLVGRHDFCALSSASGGEGSTTRQLIALEVELLEQ
ncbi:truA, partial [Symbiodinium necroappetens]